MTLNMNDVDKKNVLNVIAHKISSKTLTGGLAPNNKDAIDWGWQSLVAYGCYNIVVVADVHTLQNIQTLEKHRAHITKVKWSRENYYHDTHKPYTMKLASADATGHIVIWDVNLSVYSSVFSDGNKPVLAMEWLHNQDSCQDLLVALHQPYSLILWNAMTGTKVWKKTYSEQLLSFTFDPFEAANIAFLASDCILFVNDFSLHKLPMSNGRKFFISSSAGSNSTSMTNLTSIERDNSFEEAKSTFRSRSLRNHLSRILVGVDVKPKSEDKLSLNECLQLTFHNACRNHLLLLYPREILILDLEIYQTVGIIAVDKNASPLNQIVSCSQRDVLYCLHDNGSVSVRVRKRANTFSDSTDMTQAPDTISLGFSTDTNLEVSYDLRCQSDSLRITKHTRIMGFVVCPVSEKKVVLLTHDGRLLLLDLQVLPSVKQTSVLSPIQSPSLNSFENSKFSFEDLKSVTSSVVPSPNVDIHPRTCLSDDITPCLYPSSQKCGSPVVFKLLLTGLLPAIACPPLVFRMCPPLTTKNLKVYKPLLAVGNSMGSIQVVNVSSSAIEKEFSVHTGPVKGIEWTGLTSFLSYSFPNITSQSASVRNEIVWTDVLTGRTRLLRTDKSDESPIEMMKVSCLKQYFIIAFKEQAFELWDLKSMSVLRTMSKKFPNITALEWSPVHNVKSLRRKAARLDSSDKDTSKESVDVLKNIPDTSSSGQGHDDIFLKEQFVFTDGDGQLYHFSVEGNIIKDGTKLPPDGNMKSVTSIAWKGDQIVLGDIDGNLNLWDLSGKISRSIPTHRGWIKKIKFAPGRGVMRLLVLFVDGIDVWDAREVDLIDKIKTPKELAKIHDAEWAGSDKLVLVTGDGCIRVTTLNSHSCSSPISEYQFTENSFIPHLLQPKAALNLRCVLSHQPWSSKPYSADISDDLGISEEHFSIVKLSSSLLSPEIIAHLSHCAFGIAERCLQVGRLFGDESEIHFWTIALHYLRMEKASPMAKPPVTKPDGKKNVDEKSAEILRDAFMDQPLDLCYDMLCDSSMYLKHQLDRLALHDSKRTTYEQTSKCAENLLLLGQTDRAVHLLLETEADNKNYYTDCLRACLAATVCPSEASQSTIKLVATNLIASGNISEGVQLLCLIKKGLDACRYLQSSGRWNQAIWLAKATMSYGECCEVMKRYVDYLFTPQINQKSKAILVLLSLGQFERALELMHSMKMFERAVLFIESCIEFGHLQTSSLNMPLIQAIYLDYARYLYGLDNKKAALYYCNQVGGEQLRKEFEILEMDK